VSSWGDLEAEQPDLAAFGAQLLDRFDGLAYLATVRAGDGAPRLHPVCVWRSRGRLFLAVNNKSPKRRDLRTDTRYVLHALPGQDDAEFRIRGHSREVIDATTAGTARADGRAAGMNLPDDELLFELDIDEAHTAVWVNVGQPGTYATRQSWPAD
jgi:hypothetical protein